MAGLIAQNYSDALFSIAKEENRIDQYLEQLHLVEASLKKEPTFVQLLAHPKMAKEQKKEVLETVYGNVVEKTILNFMKLLIDKGRFSYFQNICVAFHKLYNIEYGILVVSVSSAKPLETTEVTKLQKILENKTQKKVELKLFIDEELMAGLRVKIGDQIIDNTAKTRLENLKEMVMKTDFTKETR